MFNEWRYAFAPSDSDVTDRQTDRQTFLSSSSSSSSLGLSSVPYSAPVTDNGAKGEVRRPMATRAFQFAIRIDSIRFVMRIDSNRFV